MSVDDEWCTFLNNNLNKHCNYTEPEEININSTKELNIPKCGEIYISTKTKIVYLNTNIDIYKLFWAIPIINYDLQQGGIIKKQIKISSTDKNDVIKIDDLLKKEGFSTNKIINHIDNPDGRIQFKDIRKITVGISKKDITTSRVKNKSAFYNCFVITLRLMHDKIFKEFHIKVFNTGKLEIPGIKNDDILINILNELIVILSNILKTNIYYIKNKIENVLINSNFNCGFYINRESLFNILRYKYNINTCYDPCSYPGIQCVYYYDLINQTHITNNINIADIKKNKNIVKLSYMIFRTGSILIVGKCHENILHIVYDYIKNILITEYKDIVTSNIDISNINKNPKHIKQRTKFIYIQ